MTKQLLYQDNNNVRMTDYKTSYDETTDTLHFWQENKEGRSEDSIIVNPPFVLETIITEESPLSGEIRGFKENFAEELLEESDDYKRGETTENNDIRETYLSAETVKALTKKVIESSDGDLTTKDTFWEVFRHKTNGTFHKEDMPNPATVLRAKREIKEKME